MDVTSPRRSQARGAHEDGPKRLNVPLPMPACGIALSHVHLVYESAFIIWIETPAVNAG
jgi:hypothetical protein